MSETRSGASGGSGGSDGTGGSGGTGASGRTGGRWDYNVGLVLVVVAAMILVAKLKILAFLLKLWPVALIFLGWQMVRRAREEEQREREAD